MKSYTGIIDKVYHNGYSWSAIRVGIYNKKKIDYYINASGAISYPVEGFDIEFEAEEIEDPTYGPKLNVVSSTIKRGGSEIGIMSFLSSGMIKGIGPAIAERIVKEFGKKTLKIIEDNPDELLKIKGISKNKLEKIKESYSESFNYFKVYDALNGKITPSQAKKIMDKYGDDAVKIIKKNPYKLIYDLDGFGFLKADEIAKASGIPRDSIDRVGAALIYILKNKSETDGHCFIDISSLQIEGINLLTPVPKVLTDAKKQKKLEMDMQASADEWPEARSSISETYALTKEENKVLDDWVKARDHYIDVMAQSLYNEIESERIVYEEDSEAIYWKKIYDSEVIISKIVNLMIHSDVIKKIPIENIDAVIKNIEWSSGYSLGLEQKNAIYLSLRNRLSIITGGPGRGKTTIIKGIIDAWDDDENVVLCAPTGRAAQRMKEATGRNASTLQSLIWHEFENKLIIVDESSMIDVSLGASLFKMAEKNNLILVGDVDQLPSIGAGSFFADLIKSKVIPTTILKQGYRNEGAISENAEKINDGKSYKYMRTDDDFAFYETGKENAVKKILKLYDELLEEYEIKDICLLAPMRKRSQTGTELLNKIIRDHLNPYKFGDPFIKGVDFRINDRVMNTSNNSKKEVLKDGVHQTGVYNGDCGTLVKIDSEENEITVEFDDGRIGVFEPWEMETFVLAYAITIHKSQGSEYPVCIIAMNKEHFVMLQRNLLYTAVTRGKKKIKIVGEKMAFDMAIRNTDYKMRNSNLRNRILEEKVNYTKI